MFKYDKLVNKCESRGIPYQGRIDDIRVIVSNLCYHMSNSNEKVVEQAIKEFRLLKYIHDIKIDRDKCIIEYDEGTINFSTIPEELFEFYRVSNLDKSKFSGNCHYVTQKALESCRYDGMSAVTSLCINSNYIFYFHSYIHHAYYNDNDIIDVIIDFSKNIMMDKDDYDKLFLHYEFNDLNYEEYEQKLDSSGYSAKRDNVCPLLYLACHEIEENNIDIDVLTNGNINMKR